MHSHVNMALGAAAEAAEDCHLCRVTLQLEQELKLQIVTGIGQIKAFIDQREIGHNIPLDGVAHGGPVAK